MKTLPLAATVLIALSLVASACGAPATSAPATAAPTQLSAAEMPATTAPATSAPADDGYGSVPVTGGGAMVQVAQDAVLGPFLTDDKGMALYLFTKDSPGTSTCYDKCATNWPPLLTSGDAVAGEGVDASLFGTTTRTDGSVQVTYNGWPLYYYAKDSQAGDTQGQDVGNVWYLVSPTGEQIK